MTRELWVLETRGPGGVTDDWQVEDHFVARELAEEQREWMQGRYQGVEARVVRYVPAPMALTGAELAEKHGFEPIPEYRLDPFVRPMRIMVGGFAPGNETPNNHAVELEPSPPVGGGQMTRADLIRLARHYADADADVDVEPIVDRMIERMERERRDWEQARELWEQTVIRMAADCIEAAAALKSGGDK